MARDIKGGMKRDDVLNLVREHLAEELEVDIESINSFAIVNSRGWMR